MKTLKNTFLLLFVAFLCSCSDETDETLGITGEGNLTAKVDGETFISLKAAVGASVTSGVAAIQGSNAGGEYINMTIMNYNGVGVYKTGDVLTNTNIIQYGTINPISSWISTLGSGSGTIEITEDNETTISGTFSFTGVNSNNTSKTITEGIFKAPKN